MKPVDPRLLRSADRAPIAAAAVAGVIAGCLVVIGAGLVARLVADVVDGRPAPDLAGTAAALGAVFAGRAVAAWLQEVWGERAAASAKARLREQVMTVSIHRAGDPSWEQRRGDVLTVAVDGLDALDPWFARYLPHLLAAVVVPVAVLVQLARLDPTSAIVVTLTLPLIPVFMVLVGKVTEAGTRRRLLSLQRLSHHFLDVVEGMSTLRVFGRGDAQARLVRESSDRYRVATMRTLRVAFLSSLVLELLATLSVAVVAVEVGLRLVDGDMPLRTGLFVILLAPEGYLPLRQVGTHFHSSAAGLAAAEAAFALIDAAPDDAAPSPDHPGRRSPVPGAPTLVLDAVSVRHQGRSAPAPRCLSLRARPGEVICIAGASGSGKSTALAVLLGLRRPDGGRARVEIGGVESALDDLDLADWHRRVAWVDQQPFVVDGTIAANLRLAAAEATDVELRAALARAGLGLPLDRLVTTTTISAGERRRMAVARALLRRADVVIMDEPTAGLDDAAEAAVLAAIREEADRGAVVVMAAHRPAALAAADRVVQL